MKSRIRGEIEEHRGFIRQQRLLKMAHMPTATSWWLPRLTPRCFLGTVHDIREIFTKCSFKVIKGQKCKTHFYR
jgi:hypothetical protein